MEEYVILDNSCMAPLTREAVNDGSTMHRLAGVMYRKAIHLLVEPAFELFACFACALTAPGIHPHHPYTATAEGGSLT